MMLQVIFTPVARYEVIAAQDWYEAEATGLGRRFRAEVDRTVQLMSAAPRQFPVVFGKLRRARLNKFPYGLYFSTEPDTITVAACFHSSRNPQGWQSRA